MIGVWLGGTFWSSRFVTPRLFLLSLLASMGITLGLESVPPIMFCNLVGMLWRWGDFSGKVKPRVPPVFDNTKNIVTQAYMVTLYGNGAVVHDDMRRIGDLDIVVNDERYHEMTSNTGGPPTLWVVLGYIHVHDWFEVSRHPRSDHAQPSSATIKALSRNSLITNSTLIFLWPHGSLSRGHPFP